jgi:hypothetical protein
LDIFPIIFKTKLISSCALALNTFFSKRCKQNL